MVVVRELQEFGWYLEIDFYINGFNTEMLRENLKSANEVLDILDSSNLLIQQADTRNIKAIRNILSDYIGQLNEILETMQLYESYGEEYIIEHKRLTHNALNHKLRVAYDGLLQTFNARMRINNNLVSLAWVNRYHQSTL